jgi:hypothetical protein
MVGSLSFRLADDSLLTEGAISPYSPSHRQDVRQYVLKTLHERTYPDLWPTIFERRLTPENQNLEWKRWPRIWYETHFGQLVLTKDGVRHEDSSP